MYLPVETAFQGRLGSSYDAGPVILHPAPSSQLLLHFGSDLSDFFFSPILFLLSTSSAGMSIVNAHSE